jgi:hypothetical protein
MGEQVILQTAYAADRWSDFGVGVTGAAAALAGLVFVAVSINLSEILKYRNLPGRAGSPSSCLSHRCLRGSCC